MASGKGLYSTGSIGISYSHFAILYTQGCIVTDKLLTLYASVILALTWIAGYLAGTLEL